MDGRYGVIMNPTNLLFQLNTLAFFLTIVSYIVLVEYLLLIRRRLVNASSIIRFTIVLHITIWLTVRSIWALFGYTGPTYFMSLWVMAIILQVLLIFGYLSGTRLLDNKKED